MATNGFEARIFPVMQCSLAKPITKAAPNTGISAKRLGNGVCLSNLKTPYRMRTNPAKARV